jgi:hypothetical protein
MKMSWRDPDREGTTIYKIVVNTVRRIAEIDLPTLEGKGRPMKVAAETGDRFARMVC